jgi:4-carboxymuconolactone decarboxylase
MTFATSNLGLCPECSCFIVDIGRTGAGEHHPVEGMRGGGPHLVLRSVDPPEDLLRRLAFNDEKALGMVLTGRLGVDGESELGAKVELLVRLAALLSVGAATPSLREAVDQASAAGATASEIVGVLVAVGPAVGLASVVASAPRLALAIGYDLENGHAAGSPS